MHIVLKQLYKQMGTATREVEGLNQVGHLSGEAFGQPLFHGKESVAEIKKRFQR